MDRESLIKLIRDYKSGKVNEDAVLEHLRNLPYEDIDFAKIDHHRALRWGFPEVIFCEGKTPWQVREIAARIVEKGLNLLGTRASVDMYTTVREHIPDARYNERARTITVLRKTVERIQGRVSIVTAGTSDLPVAEEALETALILGLDAAIISDIGVAGIHRMLNHREELSRAAIVIVVAGMEGALPSVVAGLIPSPVIAVPTSVGYGASFNGIAPLLGMLNSCAPGVAVMNIDNGFGASFLAFKILATAGRQRDGS